jgi:hypothetical protein
MSGPMPATIICADAGDRRSSHSILTHSTPPLMLDRVFLTLE